MTDRRTSADVAHVSRRLVDEQCPDAGKVVLVLNNLRTHTPAALSEAFDPAESRRLAERLAAWAGNPTQVDYFQSALWQICGSAIWQVE